MAKAPTPNPQGKPAKRSLGGWFGVLFGAALLVWVLYSKDGVDVLFGVIDQLGPKWPWLLTTYALTGAFTVWAYRIALPGRGVAVPLRVLVHAERSGFILNSVLPLANYGGNLAKVALLRHWYRSSEILAAGVWGALGTGLTNIVGALGPIVALAVGLGEPKATAVLAALTFATAVPSVVLMFLLPYGLAARVTALSRLFPRLIAPERQERWLGKAREFDRDLAGAIGARRGDFVYHVAMKAVVQLSRIAEVWLIIELLGIEGGLLAALLFNAISRTAGQLLSFVPGQLGVIEGSAMLGFAALGFSEADGLAVALALRFHFFVAVIVSGTALATSSRVLAKYPPTAHPSKEATDPTGLS